MGKAGGCCWTHANLSVCSSMCVRQLFEIFSKGCLEISRSVSTLQAYNSSVYIFLFSHKYIVF